MLITRTSQYSKKIRTYDLDVTTEELRLWRGGMSAQQAFPALNAGEREFIMTGISTEEWDAMFPPDDSWSEEFMECPNCKEIALAQDGGECTECHMEAYL